MENNSSYVSVGNNGELWVIDGTPNHDYAPNIFALRPGSGGGKYKIYTCGIMPQCGKALTVMKEMGQWKIKFSDDTRHNYDWCFTCENGVFTIQWCGMDEVEETRFVLYRYQDQSQGDQLLLTQTATPSSEQHFHIFESVSVASS